MQPLTLPGDWYYKSILPLMSVILLQCSQSIVMCCDMCLTNCKCSHCPSSHVFLLTDLQEDIKWCAAVSKCELMCCQIVSEIQRNKLHDKLKEYRESCLVNNVPCLLNVGILSGLSDWLIASIVNNVHYIGNVEDLMSEYIFDNNLTRSIMSIIDGIIEDWFMMYILVNILPVYIVPVYIQVNKLCLHESMWLIKYHLGYIMNIISEWFLCVLFERA